MKFRQYLTKAFSKYRQFMYGRYGADELCFALVIVSMVLMVISNFDKLKFFYLIALIPLGIALWRSLSRNTNARYNEKLKFLQFIAGPKEKIKLFSNRIRDRKTHRYFSCSNCKATLRVPKGRGKINITCPKCGNSMIKKT